MYHYVRKSKLSRYPEIKGLETGLFEQQIGFLKKHHHVISAHDLMDAITSNSPLPPRAVLLTFDDGYADHFDQVLPVLLREKLPGCFFPPARALLEGRVLDVNKIHFILASVEDKSALVDAIYRSIDENRSSHQLESKQFYWEKRGVRSRWDPPEVMFVKHMLQRELPLELRQDITNRLFREFVSNDEAAFSKELYMGLDQIAYLQGSGMYVGSHGYDHCWLDSISADAQKLDIDLSLDFLRKVGSSTDRWIMCFPHGKYDDSLLSVLRSRSCTAGLTTEVRIADLDEDDPLTLPRLDTNDLPKDSRAEPNAWTKQATASR